MTKIATMELIVVTRITNINNSLTMISMGAMWHHFYVGLQLVKTLVIHRHSSACNESIRQLRTNTNYLQS